MGGFLFGLGARATASAVVVGTMLVASRAAAQSATPASAAPVVNTAPAAAPTASEAAQATAAPVASAPPSTPVPIAPPSAEMPRSFVVPPIEGVGRSRKRKHTSLEDLRPISVSLRVPLHQFVVLGEGDAEVATCSDQCQFWAYPGNYAIQLASTREREGERLRLRVGKPGIYSVVLGDKNDRDLGLVLGATGGAMFIVGAIISFVALVDEKCPDAVDEGGPDDCTISHSIYYGLATMGVGAGFAAAGFTIFATNRTGVRYDGSPYPVTARVGAVPVAGGGLGLGTTITF